MPLLLECVEAMTPKTPNSTPLQKQTKNVYIQRASTYPLADRLIRSSYSNFPPRLNLCKDVDLPQPSSSCSHSPVVLQGSLPTLHLPSQLPSPTSPNPDSAVLSMLLPPTPSPLGSDTLFSPMNVESCQNEVILPASPLHHNYPLESDIGPLFEETEASQHSYQPTICESSNNPSTSDKEVVESFLFSAFHCPPHRNLSWSQNDDPFVAAQGLDRPDSVSEFPVSTSQHGSASDPKRTSHNQDVKSQVETIWTTAQTNITDLEETSKTSHQNTVSSSFLSLQENWIMMPQNREKALMENDHEKKCEEMRNSKLVSPLYADKPEKSPRALIQRRVRGRRSSPNSKLKCPECNQLYSRRDNLRAHMRGIHQGRKPYQCTNCGERFRWASTLRSHEVTNRCKQVCPAQQPHERLPVPPCFIPPKLSHKTMAISHEMPPSLSRSSQIGAFETDRRQRLAQNGLNIHEIQSNPVLKQEPNFGFVDLTGMIYRSGNNSFAAENVSIDGERSTTQSVPKELLTAISSVDGIGPWMEHIRNVEGSTPIQK